MRISLVQTDIVWEDKKKNLSLLQKKLEPLEGQTDLVVLPEMFSTGFSMHSRLLAETTNDVTIRTLKEWSRKYNFAIAGSFIAVDKEKFYNRAFFLTPSDEEYYYDKKHLFRMGEESSFFAAGTKRTLLSYKEFKICLSVCYDLRFPVWLRNKNNEYDLLITVASWPTPRLFAWEALLYARAIENQCYVCGVNRVGTDGNRLHYSGKSLLLNAKGERLLELSENEENILTKEIDLASLQKFREKFPVWKDADNFTLL